MTKRRAALTFENALTKVAGRIGWSAVARICNRAERTVRAMSDPDVTSCVTLAQARDLDVAYRAAAAADEPDGAPFLICYATQVEAAVQAACPTREVLLACASASAKEGGEAVAALLGAAHPLASLATIAGAEREIEEAIASLTASLQALRAKRDATHQGEQLLDLDASLTAAGLQLQ
ncbi:hypothetical protein [Sphingomonas ginkgonis]|uniref:hypothetical protein n=1 Tax=Sphingomonas ginkgonis TaxID=2315330 RepID=UPI00163AEF03|nr:hypothetical protein [Sphingomonas ginkgonis]